MNTSDETLEQLLRAAPAPRPDPTLQQALLKEIDLAKTEPPAVIASTWFGKNWPLLAAACWATFCIVVLGVQQAQIQALKRQLQRPTPVPATAQRAVASVPPGATAVEEGGNTRSELERLRVEVARLRAEVNQVTVLREQKAALQADLARLHQVPPGVEQALAEAKARANAIACVNNLKQLGLAARIWSVDHGNAPLPADFLSFQNILPSPKLLLCPADETHVAAKDWTSFTQANNSYEYLGEGADGNEALRVIMRCSIHQSVGLNDGSVHKSPSGLISKNGHLYLRTTP